MAVIRVEAGIKSVSCAHDQHLECAGEAMYGDGRLDHELDLLVSDCICSCHGEEVDDAERWHLEIEDDDGKPFVSGCDCDLQRDHYAWPEPFHRPDQ